MYQLVKASLWLYAQATVLLFLMSEWGMTKKEASAWVKRHSGAELDGFEGKEFLALVENLDC